jgi:hypothetical protein
MRSTVRIDDDLLLELKEQGAQRKYVVEPTAEQDLARGVATYFKR